MNSQAEPPAGAGLPAHERTYRALRDAVLFGALAPGEPVTIQGLTERLNTGMTPVREALRRLTAEGALQTLGNRRIMVPVLDAAAVEELTEARLALEPRLAARAATHADKVGIAALRAIDARLDRAIARGDVTGYLAENHAFHAHLNALAQAPILTSLVEGLWLRFGPSLRIVCGQVGTRNLPDLHKDLLTALETGDTEAASAAIAGDVAQGMDLIAQNL
ncbi:GntR family transcriptional regulator [Tropicibacter alexandrii]|uniref:GntR family transcriptional regulator n=1 Tax=Tropicibacter alexandrii TaxID=2267683 RepID=UPI000EF497E1|nr:GntR family transcriptional regulator [Tropicibacter alexandrii]